MTTTNAYTLVTDRSEIDVAAVHAFLTQAYWSKGIPIEVVARAIAHSLCVGIKFGGAQVSFARVITDQATFAYLADVYVLEPHRGQGLSVRMLQALQAMPGLQGLRRQLLATRDAHGLYARFGYRPVAAPDRLMEILVPDVYERAGRGPGAA